MLDITAFANALRHGKVSFLDALRVRPFVGSDDTVISFTGEDAVVFPLVSEGIQPQYALRVPLEHGSGRTWPVQYADLVTASAAIARFLPAEITILDVEDMPGVEVALLHDWVPGETLTARVGRARSRQDRDSLVELLWPLADIGDALRVSGMVHGDIAPGNIVVRPDGGMTLIDLDRMGYRDAPDIQPRRRAGYRLPRGGGSPVEEDAFALLVLMTTCAVLADSSVHVDRERASESSHPMLLFSSWDLMDLQRSRLVREVEGELSPLSQALLDLLVAAGNGRSDRVPDLLRDAIRQVRRYCTSPDPVGLAGSDRFETWQPAAVAHAGHAMSPGEPELSEIDVSEPEAPVAAAAGSWPEPTTPPRVDSSAPTMPSRPSVGDLIQRLQSIQPVEPRRIAANRRAARAERRREAVATQLHDALARNDRETLVRLAMSGSLAELGDSDRSELVQVVRALAHDSISRAIAADDDGMIVAAVDESVFEQESDLDPAFRDRVRLARARLRWADRLVEAVHDRDASLCAVLVRDAPEGAMERLPLPIREQASRLVAQNEAVVAANEALHHRDADALARALGRLVKVRHVWMDHIDPQAVVALLGEDQIEDRLAGRLAAGDIGEDEQWMVDIVIHTGRLPEVSRVAGLTPARANAMVFGDG